MLRLSDCCCCYYYYHHHHHHHYCYYPGGIETDAIDIDAAVIALAREHPYKLG